MSNELVIVVTGANGGVGFGICHRLLVQLSSRHPSDAQPYFKVEREKAQGLELPERSPDAGVTIVMACRDPKRAQDAREKLYRLLDKHIATLKKGTQDHAYAVAFRSSVRLDIERLDLSSVRSVLEFSKAVTQKYEYVSHLIFNAGTATYSHLDILGFTYDLLIHPIDAIEHPRRNMQINGVLSEDGLGYTWQCNVFGHYVLYRSVQPLLVACAHKTSSPARVIWMSSLDSEPIFDLKEDWQLTKTMHSYNASKFQIELIVAELERRTFEGAPSIPDVSAPNGEFHHYIVSPGITATNMSTLLNIPIPGYRYLMLAAFYIVRFIGSPHVLLSLYSAAVAAVHLALIPLLAIPTARDTVHVPPEDIPWPSWHSYFGKFTGSAAPPRVLTLRFGAENDRWGNDRPGVMAVPVWEEHPDAGAQLLERFERLYQVFLLKEGESASGAAANGHVE
ncbi:uncharacterized protein TRAVEDRAFT_73290 [Trametes versicolor FP-101664 SS1]|uniref:uncharacterized protein n=1 Tax=Trametes versicolor (strain FP-101664) TaxID=717944 RepID=UPI00046234DB|nr:uncharacterized protein TRAVEDRAFT_73290 [Trametes versicolor FP-101664 SS1]EIW56997.1 hypothetical protein TRAVEDRAFT_73290 [Trametes versicolor FP-101664 SS1]